MMVFRIAPVPVTSREEVKNCQKGKHNYHENNNFQQKCKFASELQKKQQLKSDKKMVYIFREIFITSHLHKNISEISVKCIFSLNEVHVYLT